jgi:ribosomal silencing factor RsfS
MKALVSKRKFEKLLRNVRHHAHLYRIISNKSMPGRRAEIWDLVDYGNDYVH